MILTKEVTIKLNRGNIPYWKQYDEYKKTKIGDTIVVPIENVPKTTVYKISVKCDLCGREREIFYSTYWDSTKKGTEIYVCKGKCSNIKREQTNMELYGVKNCFQSNEKKIKIKKTMKDLYGVEHNMKLQRCLDQRVETYNRNYGCDNPTQDHEILKKSFTTGNKIRIYKDTNLYYQGSYELHFLERYFNLMKIERGFSIKYTMNGENKVYHPDFYLPDLNMIIEIKSSYWFEKFKERIQNQKKEIVKKYNYFLIINKNYTEFDKFIENQKSAL